MAKQRIDQHGAKGGGDSTGDPASHRFAQVTPPQSKGVSKTGCQAAAHLRIRRFQAN
jgi:hypothetical protein